MKYMYCLLTCLIISSCTPNEIRRQNKKIRENSSKLTELISKKSTNINPWVVDLDIADERASVIKNEKGIVFLYLINAECSSCIADYLIFIKIADRIKLKNVHVYGILNKNHKDLLDYYAEQFDIDSTIKQVNSYLLSVESPYPFGNKEPQYNLVIIRDGYVIGKCFFSGNELLFIN